MTVETPQELVARYLLPNESLLWIGRPRQGLLLRPVDALAIPFSLLWAGFAGLFGYTFMMSDGPLPLRLFGLLFVLVSLYVVFGRFIVDAWLRSRTVYALTNQRVMIITKVLRTNLTSLALATLAQVSLSERRDGSGTIMFGQPPPWYAGGAGWPGAGRSQPPAFEGVDNARWLHDQIRLAQMRA